MFLCNKQLNASASTSAITLDSVSFGYENNPPKKIIKDLSFSIPASKLVAIIGPNGSGKSTLLKLIFNLMKPQKGTIELFGREIGLYNLKELTSILNFLPQQLERNLSFTVRDLLFLSLLHHPLKNEEKEILTNRKISQMGLFEKRDTSLYKLSGGELKKVYLALLFLQNSKIILLDEPLTHLDLKTQGELLYHLREQVNVHKTTIVVVLHDLYFLSQFDQILLLGADAAIGPLSLKELTTNPQFKELYKNRFFELTFTDNNETLFNFNPENSLE